MNVQMVQHRAPHAGNGHVHIEIYLQNGNRHSKKGIKNATLDILAPIISCNLIPWLRSFFLSEKYK